MEPRGRKRQVLRQERRVVVLSAGGLVTLGRRFAGVVMCATALIGTSLGWVPPAQAHDGEAIACAGEESTAFSPGLTLTPRPTDVQARAAYRCGDLRGGAMPATGYLFSHSSQSTCLTLNSGQAQETVRYGDGRQSEISYTSASAVRVAGVSIVTLRGTVIEGRAKGGEASRTIAVLPSSLPTACLTPEGLQRAAGRVQLEIQP